MREKIGDFLINCARGAFLAQVMAAAALYGLTREGGIQTFNWTMGATVCIWILGYIAGGRWPRIGWLLPLGVVSILAFGWVITGSAYWDPAGGDPLTGPPWLSDFALRVATFDLNLSLAAMVRTGVLLGSLLLVVDLFSAPR